MVSKYVLPGVGLFAIILISYYFSLDTAPQLSVCEPKQLSNQILVENNLEDYLVLAAAKSISALKPLDSSNIESFEQYQNFADTTNVAVSILNEKLLLQIPTLQVTSTEYDKATKMIARYAPVVDSYNKMIHSANNVDPLNEDSVNCFLSRSAIFSLELAVVYTAFYAGPTYNAVNVIHRSWGFQQLAVKCASCVEAALSYVHWNMRTAFVQGTSLAATTALNEIDRLRKEMVSVP